MCRHGNCPRILPDGDGWVVVMGERRRQTPDLWQALVWVHQAGLTVSAQPVEAPSASHRRSQLLRL
jgi:hypothetical protein